MIFVPFPSCEFPPRVVVLVVLVLILEVVASSRSCLLCDVTMIPVAIAPPSKAAIRNKVNIFIPGEADLYLFLIPTKPPSILT